MLLNMINFTAYMKKIDKKKICLHTNTVIKKLSYTSFGGFFLYRGRQRERQRAHDFLRNIIDG